MSDSKIYMFPENGYSNGSHDAALWATLANRRDDNNPLATAAMVNGGMNSQWNNPLTTLK